MTQVDSLYVLGSFICKRRFTFWKKTLSICINNVETFNITPERLSSLDIFYKSFWYDYHVDNCFRPTIVIDCR